MRQATRSEGKVFNAEVCKKSVLGIEKTIIDYISVYIAGLLHEGNSLQQLYRYFEKSFRIETLPFLMVVVHDYVNSRANKTRTRDTDGIRWDLYEGNRRVVGQCFQSIDFLLNAPLVLVKCEASETGLSYLLL